MRVWGGGGSLARESWKSGWGFEADVLVVMFEGGGVGLTTSSRHCGVFDWDNGLVRGMGPVGVSRVRLDWLGFGGTDWKAWIGRASKNSWAKMKGLLVGSEQHVNKVDTFPVRRKQDIPFGTKRISSHHVTGICEYLLIL